MARRSTLFSGSVSGRARVAVGVLAVGLTLGTASGMPAALASAPAPPSATKASPPSAKVAKREAHKSTKLKTPDVPATQQFTPTSRATQLASGKTRLEQFSSVRFRRTADGWRELSGGLTPGSGMVAAKADGMAHPIWFGADARRSLLQVRLPEGNPTLSLPSARTSKPVLGKTKAGLQTITYRDVAVDTDLTYTVDGSRVSKQLVLKSAQAPTSFTFHLSDPKHLLGKPTARPGGSFVFSQDLGDGLQLALNQPMAWEQGGTPAPSSSAHQVVTKAKGGYDITVSLDPGWAKDKKHPLVLDPTIEYSWAAGTLATAYAPVWSADCDPTPCPLSSTTDGSYFGGWTETDQFAGYVHADLSNFPRALPIVSAQVLVGWDSDDGYWYPRLMHYPTAQADPTTGADLENAWDGSDYWYAGGRETENTTSGGHPEWAIDVTDMVSDWVRSGHGDSVRFVTSMWCNCSRGMAAKAAPVTPPGPTDLGWSYEPRLVIEYQGRPLPPPIPVEQGFGCDCRWVHGAGVTGQRLDPVNTAAGGSVEPFQDLPAGSAAGVPAAFTRTYNGKDTRVGPLGRGWTHAFEARLEEDPVTGNVTFRDPTGGVSRYVKQLDGSYVGDPGVTAVLESVAGGGWSLVSEKGEKLTFDAAGAVLSDVDRAGLGLTFGYAGSRLTTVTDSGGQTVTFTYGTAGAATGKIVKAESSTGTQVTYGYTTIGGDVFLSQVTDVIGETTQFSYAADGQLTGVQDPNGGTRAQNVYDPTTGRLTSQTDADGHTWTLSWDDAMQTQTMTSPEGVVTKDVYYGNVLIKHIAGDGGTTSYFYDDNLNLVAVTDPRGNTTQMLYDESGRLATRLSAAPYNLREDWSYTEEGQVEVYFDVAGAQTYYEYDTSGRPSSTTGPESESSATLTYNASGQMATRTDRRGKTTAYGYDSAGDLTSVTDPNGDVTTMAYNSRHQLTGLTDPRGNVSGCACAAQFTTTWTRDEAGRPLTQTDPAGAVTSFTYDDAGNLLTQTTPAGTTTYTYTPGHRVHTVTDARGKTTTNTYDDDGNLTAVTDPLGSTTSYTYDGAGRVKTVTRPAGNAAGATAATKAANTTTYTYDPAGNLTSTSQPDPASPGQAITTSTTYDELNRPVNRTDPLGHVTTTAYDVAERITSVTDPTGAVTDTLEDAAGRLSAIFDPAGVTTTYVRDEEGNVLTEGVGGSPWDDTFPIATTYTYDNAGRMVTMTDPRGNESGCDCAADYTTTYGYDPAGNITSATDPLGHTTSTTYDALSRPVTRIDPRGKATTLSYDSAGRVHTITTPTSRTTTYSYDANGNVTGREDPRGGTTTYNYDDVGQLTSTTSPNGKLTSFTYDTNGNRTKVITPAGNATTTPGDGTVDLAYDSLGRLLSTTFSDGTPAVAWAYDKTGRITTMTDALSATQGDQTRAYDDAGRLTQIVRGSDQFAYTYDAAGRPATLEYPDGRTTSLGYDTYGRLHTQAWDSGNSVVYDYDLAGNLTTASRSTGLTTTWTYDRASRTTAAETGTAAGAVADFSQTVDAGGNPTVITATRAGIGSTTTQYTYDDSGQITKACYADPCTGSSPTITYSYDANGNRTQTVRAGVPDPGTTNYAYDADDQLTATTDAGSATVDTYGHDGNGNLAAVTGTHPATYTTNLAGRLTQATVGSATTTYTYDGDGNRAASTTGGATTAYVWDAAQPNPLLVATDRTGTAQDLQLAYGPTGPLTITADGDTAWYLQDLQANTTDLLDPSGTILGSEQLDPFGTSLAATGTDPLVTLNPLQFASESLDPATGLYNNRARQYDPTLGRFTGIDPVTLAAGAGFISAYTYTANQPTTHIDPSGMVSTVNGPGGGGDGISPQAKELWWNVVPGDQIIAQSADVAGGFLLEGRDLLVGASQFRACGALGDPSRCGELLSQTASTVLHPKQLYHCMVDPITDAWADGDYGIAIGRVGFSVASFAYTPSKAGSLLRAGRGAAAKTATGAESAVNGARLGTHLRQLEKYGQGGFRELESGRIRYYGDLSPAAKQGEMAGRRLVREWDPASGATRTWHETLDHSGNVRIVRPETGGSKTHYYFDESGGYGGAW